MSKEKIYSRRDNATPKGFTLIELLVAIGIISILASVVFVGFSSYRASARSAKASVSLSSAIPSLVSCWSNGGNVLAPSENHDICKLGSSYGQWPSFGNYNYTYSEAGPIQPSCGAPPTRIPLPDCISKTNWYFSAANDSDQKKVCCNQVMNGCKVLDYSETCDNTVD